MFLSLSCSKRTYKQKVEHVIDTTYVSIPERTETLVVQAGNILLKDTIIAQRDTIEKVTIKLIKVSDSILVECQCDSLTISHVDTIKQIFTTQKIIEKRKKLSTFERIFVIAGIIFACILFYKAVR